MKAEFLVQYYSYASTNCNRRSKRNNYHNISISDPNVLDKCNSECCITGRCWNSDELDFVQSNAACMSMLQFGHALQCACETIEGCVDSL